MTNIEKIIAANLILCFGINFCANYADKNPNSWASPFTNTHPIGLIFGVIALILIIRSRLSTKNVAK